MHQTSNITSTLPPPPPKKKQTEQKTVFETRTFRTNTLSHYHLTSLFLPPLLHRPSGGTLVTVSSVLAHLGGASHLSAYSGSKAATSTFHWSLTGELASSYPHIKTILVAPGQLDTGMFAGVRMGWLRGFFAPVVEVRELAVKLVGMIDQGEGGVIALPEYAGWSAWYWVLPCGVRRVLRGLSGIDGAMGWGRGRGRWRRSRRKGDWFFYICL